MRQFWHTLKKVEKIVSGDRQNYLLFPFETDREEDMESKLTWCCILCSSSIWTMGVVWLNPLNSKSDQHLVSPNNYTTESFIWGHEKNRNDHQLKKPLIVKQILLVSTLGKVSITVWRICILMLGCKGLRVNWG